MVRFQVVVGMMVASWFIGGALCHAQPQGEAAERTTEPTVLTEIQITSSADQSLQKSLVWAPEQAKTEPRPVLIFLHSWSANYRQKNDTWLEQAAARGWIYLHPDFRGPNNTPQGCGSELAQQDILDVLAWARMNYQVDNQRVYLAGVSGGGHMALLMAGKHPQAFSAVSAYVPISDLNAWHSFHLKNGVPGVYARNIEASCGGAPGASAEVDRQYFERSSRNFLQNVGDLPVDIAAGVHDGHTGSVPVRHSLWAFNVLAGDSAPDQLVSEEEMEQLWTSRKLSQPKPSDLASDAAFERKIHLRRSAKSSRVTIFEGAHEGLTNSSIEWLEKHNRVTK